MPRPLGPDDLYDLELITDAAVSPDGQRVAYVVSRPDREADELRTAIHLVTREEGEGRRLTDPEAGATAPRWSPDGATLAFLRDEQVWLLPVDGGEARRLTDLALGAGPVSWSPAGDALLVIAPRHAAGDDAPGKDELARAPIAVDELFHKLDGVGRFGAVRRQVARVEVATGEVTWLTEGGTNVLSAGWSPDGASIAFTRTHREGRDLDVASAVWTAAADGTGEPRSVLEVDGDVGWVGYTPDGAELLLVFSAVSFSGEPYRLATVPVDGGAPRVLAGDLDRNVVAPLLGAGGVEPFVVGDHVLFGIEDRGDVALVRVPLAGGPVEPVLAGEGRRVTRVTASGDDAWLAALDVSPGRVGDVTVASPDGSDQRRVTEHHHEGWLAEVELHTYERRSFAAPDGTQLEGFVLRPDAPDGPTPLLLDIHGGPHGQHGGVFVLPYWYHHLLVSQGWTVLLLNPRGSGGYGREFALATVGAWGRGDLADFEAAVDALIDEGVADPDRLAVTGYSYGGYMTNWIVTQTDRYRAAVSGGCVSDLVSFAGTSDVGWHFLANEMGGGLYAAVDTYRDLSPVTHAADVTTPTLVLHGGADERCPVGQSEQWYVALRLHDVPTQLVVYPGATHALRAGATRPSVPVDYGQRLVDWLTRYVP